MSTELLSASFGARLALARRHRTLTYRAVGDAAGISHTAVQLLEHSKRSPTIETVERLAIALDVPPSWLAFGVGRAPSWAGA